MDNIKLGAVEERFADLIWQNEPLGSRELARICERELNWKRPTTYNVLRKLCDKGIFQNIDVVSESFGGSLPAFIAAFTARNTLTDEEADAIRVLIDKARREV